jgi:hypothetical protein
MQSTKASARAGNGLLPVSYGARATAEIELTTAEIFP